ncbi:sensor domain-containing diguanylate cyclase [Rhizobium sp. CFBP 8752]|uniref:diguanylate cyclase n=1 Tax=Rhizobium sp. CFBP 8752 TaxID=2775301 RepID=UPI001780DCC8|nr:sensor domain-containing diguanylate cyclase [Rhizobium sp. CFBP 8752]
MQQPQDDEYEQLLQFVYACPVGLVDIEKDGTIRLMNPLAMNLMMSLSTDGMATNLLEALQNYAPELRSLVQDFSAKRGTICSNHRIYLGPEDTGSSDAPKVLSCTIVKLKDERYVVTLADVSLQVRQERRLREAETWFGSLLEGVKDFGVASLGPDGRINAVNSTLSLQTGYDESELNGLSVEDLMEDRPEGTLLSTAHRLEQARKDGWHLDEGWGSRQNGERYWCQSLIAVCVDELSNDQRSIRGYTVIMREVERRDTDMRELKKLLQTDHLTSAYNRGAFFDAANREHISSQRLGRPFALVTFDIDHFKLINDSYGHGAGDDALRTISKVCINAVRPGHVFARIGGEEFAIILPGAALEEAVELAESLRKIIASTAIVTQKSTICVTASFGCAEGLGAQQSVASILADADAALYQAKRAGRNRTAPPLTANETQ